jgi:exodeoxyribonuclease V alpha subunit
VKTILQVSENGFCVCKYKTKDDSVPSEARDKNSPPGFIQFTATGYMLPLTDLIEVELEGTWQRHERHGLQFNVEQHAEIMPLTKEGITAYLGSGLIKWIGPKTARAIVNKFGLDTLEVMENQPELLRNIRGVSDARLGKIKASFAESRSMRDIVSYLSPFGISLKSIAKIQKEFGGNALQIIKTQPFRLCAISGFGFKSVDAIARKTHCNLSDALRTRGGIVYLLDEAAVSGHLYLPLDELAAKAYTLLNEGMEREVIGIGDIRAELDGMLKTNQIQSDIGRVYKAMYRKAEITVARKVLELLISESPLKADIEKEMMESQKKLGIRLAERQKDAVRMWFGSMLSIITGGPGVGKTTILQVILDIYQRIKPDGEILLAAPTGRASKRMVETTGYSSASTLHSALGLFSEDGDDGFYGEKTPVSADLVVVDEMSMIDMLLAGELFSRIESGTQLLLVGDPDQLPSVGPGSVLRELLRCRLIPAVHLDEIFRQKANSRIYINAKAINAGDTKAISYGDDFEFIKTDDSGEAAQIVLDTFLAEVAQHGLENVQILAPFKSRGETCVQKLNERAHDLINPPAKGSPEYRHGMTVYRVGDKVMQTKNNYNIAWTKDDGEQGKGVNNGDIGFIVSFTEKDDEFLMKVRFSDSYEVAYSAEDMDQLEHAYAISIHKSQGSEFLSVITPLLKENYIILRRNLVYTAASRAKLKMTFVGQKQALYIAISRNDVDKRNTLLADRIVSYHRKRLAARATAQ